MAQVGELREKIVAERPRVRPVPADLPAAALSRPHTILSRLVLPLPFAPVTTSTSPASRANSMPEKRSVARPGRRRGFRRKARDREKARSLSRFPTQDTSVRLTLRRHSARVRGL